MLVKFYCWWYGRLNLKGAGFFLSKVAHSVPGLQTFPLDVPGVGVIKVDFRDTSAFVWQNYLLGKKCQEHGLLIAMARYCEPNGVLWDIGANIGLISAFFAGADFRLRVIHAFEPNPEIYGRLNCLFSQHPIMHGHNMALSSENSRKQLHVPIGGSCLGSLDQEFVGGKTANFTVECYTGDDLLERGLVAPPTVMKIDVEGHELDVLEGMKNILSKYRPVVFIEHIFMDDTIPLQFAGYSVMTISDDDGTLLAGFMPEYGHNIALLPIES